MQRNRNILKISIPHNLKIRGMNNLNPVNYEKVGRERIKQEQQKNQISDCSKFNFQFNEFTNKIDLTKIKKEETLWVLGTGYGLSLLPKNLLQMLNTKPTLAFHNSFPHIKTMYGITPTYWTWLDPSAAIEGLKFLSKNVNVKTTPIIHKGLVGNGINFKKYFGNTSCNLKEYYDLLKSINHHIPFYIPNSTSIKALSWVDKEFVINNPHKRNDFGFVVGSTFTNSKINDNKHNKIEDGMSMVENKLSSFILPLAHYLGFKRIIYVGFEGTGPRFFDMNNLKIGAGRPGYDDGLQNWSKWSKKLEIEIFSLIPSDKSKTTKFFNYITLDEALKKY
jgi:hypothetical protein